MYALAAVEVRKQITVMNHHYFLTLVEENPGVCSVVYLQETDGRKGPQVGWVFLYHPEGESSPFLAIHGSRGAWVYLCYNSRLKCEQMRLVNASWNSDTITPVTEHCNLIALVFIESLN